MYYVVHIIMLWFGFSIGAAAWASVAASSTSYSDAMYGQQPYWWFGGLIGAGIGWAVAGKLVGGAPQKTVATQNPKTTPDITPGATTSSEPSPVANNLVPCPDCHMLISRRAVACPKCGCPPENAQ